MVKRTDESKLEQFTRDCLGWAVVIEVEKILAAHWRVAQQNAPYTDLAALVDIEDFTQAYSDIKGDQETVAAVLEIAVQLGYGPQAATKSEVGVLTKEEGLKRHIRYMIQELYHELDNAVETGHYEEIKLHAESLLGVADLTLRPHPELHDLLEDAIEKTERAYRTYVKKAEVEEGRVRKEGYLELADQYLENIGAAEEQAAILNRILKHLQYKKATSE